MKEKDISALIRKYEQMLESGRSIYFDAEEFDDLAEYYDMLDEIDSAKQVVETGLKIHPENPSLLLKTVKFMIYAGKYNEALEYMNKTFDSYDFELYLLKIECLLQLNLYDEADVLTQDVLNDEDTDKDIIFSELGFLYSETEYYDEAISFLEESLAHNPQNIDVLTELAYAYEVRSYFDSAIIVINKLLDIDPYSFDGWVNLGKFYSLQDEFEKAIDAFDFALTISESNDVSKLKAHCLSLCNRVEEAIVVFKECITDNPYDESLYYSLSECYFSLGQYDEMLHCLDKYEELHGVTAEMFAKKALIYLQKEDFDTAYSFLQSGMEIDGESEDLNIVAGELSFRLGKYALAESYFLKAYEKTQANTTMLDRLSLICISGNDIEKAIIYTEKLVIADPDPLNKTRLALLYFEADDKQKFNQYLDTFNDDELKSLVKLFFSKDEFDLSHISRDVLINKLNDARECRQLFKNIVY